MPDENQEVEEKLSLLGEKLRAGAANIRPVPKEVLEQALKPTQAPAEEQKPKQNRLKRRRRRGPSR